MSENKGVAVQLSANRGTFLFIRTPAARESKTCSSAVFHLSGTLRKTIVISQN